jgi:hypothetical protein
MMPLLRMSEPGIGKGQNFWKSVVFLVFSAGWRFN